MNAAVRLLLAVLLAVVPNWAVADDVYQAPEDFVSDVFAGVPPEPQVLWITPELRSAMAEILGHAPGMLRARYWGRGGRTAWIIEEIGKERPITTGIVVDRGRIELVRILIYRESVGWEVRYPFFTDQFKGARLEEDKRLSQGIDGISGATLSVRALTRLARLALFLHGRTEHAGE